jgi:hypothetical protein
MLCPLQLDLRLGPLRRQCVAAGAGVSAEALAFCAFYAFYAWLTGSVGFAGAVLCGWTGVLFLAFDSSFLAAASSAASCLASEAQARSSWCRPTSVSILSCVQDFKMHLGLSSFALSSDVTLAASSMKSVFVSMTAQGRCFGILLGNWHWHWSAMPVYRYMCIFIYHI